MIIHGKQLAEYFLTLYRSTFRRMMLSILLISLLVTPISSEGQKTKPDPYFEEWKENAWKRPSQCHVCRLLVTEIYSALNRTNKKDVLYTGYEIDNDEKKSIAYEKSELRLMECVENVCDTMKSYVSRARRKFPYVKGVKSHFRERLDNLVKESKVKLNIDAPPDDILDDSTKEIIRLKFKCVHMLEEYEDDITEWYMENREEDLMSWLCKQRVLEKLDQECLNESDELLVSEDSTTTKMDSNSNGEQSLDQQYKGKENLDESDVHLEL